MVFKMEFKSDQRFTIIVMVNPKGMCHFEYGHQWLVKINHLA